MPEIIVVDNMFPMWAYRAVFTAPATPSGNYTVKIEPARGRLTILSLVLGKDAYAADRSILIKVKDENGDLVKTLMSCALNNQYAEGVGLLVLSDDTTNITGAANAAVGNPPNFEIRYPDYLEIEFLAPAASETLTFNIRAILREYDTLPTITVSGTDATKAGNLAESYNKII